VSSATACAPPDLARPPRWRGLDAAHDVGGEEAEQSVDVAARCRPAERLDDGTVCRQVGRDARVGRAAHTGPGAARELLRGDRRPAHDRRDLVERHGEQVVQHEGHPLGGRQPVEHDEHRLPHRLGVLGRVRRVGGTDGDRPTELDASAGTGVGDHIRAHGQRLFRPPTA
jgi:hypothetical protein